MRGLHDELIQGGVVCAPTARVGLLGQVLAQGLLGCELAAELEPLAKGGEVGARRVREVVDVDVGATEWVRALEACVKGDTCITSEGVQAMQVSHSRGHHDLVRERHQWKCSSAGGHIWIRQLQYVDASLKSDLVPTISSSPPYSPFFWNADVHYLKFKNLVAALTDRALALGPDCQQLDRDASGPAEPLLLHLAELDVRADSVRVQGEAVDKPHLQVGQALA